MRSKLAQFLINKNRTTGERAFDQSLFPIVAFLILGVISAMRTVRRSFHDYDLPPLQPQWWETWLPLAVGLVLAILWLRALRSFIKGWNDPSAKVLRFASLICLVVFGLIIAAFLRFPFQ